MTQAVFAPQWNGAHGVLAPQFPLPPRGMDLQERGDSVAIDGDNILQAYFGEFVPTPGFMQLQGAADSVDVELSPATAVAGAIVEAGDATEIDGFATPASSRFDGQELADSCDIEGHFFIALDCQEAGDACKGDGIGGDVWTVLGPTQAQWTDGSKVINVWIDETRNGGR